MYFDYIFVGGSISCLLASTTLSSQKSVLIIEKDNYLGGAWRVDSNEHTSIDLVGHLIVPKNNCSGDSIIKKFKEMDIHLKYIDSNELLCETETYRGNGKNGDSIICENGWVKFHNKIIEYVNCFKNITILKNVEVLHIHVTTKLNKLKSKNHIFFCEKLVIPSYCNIDKILYDDKSIDIPYENIINTHVLLDIHCSNCSISKNFQAFLDKEPIDIFDRISVSDISNNTIVLSCRISKSHKYLSKEILEKRYKNFLIEKSILSLPFHIKNISYHQYECSYRDINNNRKKIKDVCEYINKYYGVSKISYLNTTYMGHFLDDWVNNKLDL